MQKDIPQNKNIQDEEYDFCHIESGQRFVVKWSPKQDVKWMSQNQYRSPRNFNNTAIRKNKSLTRYRISKSLNFEAETTKSDGLKTPGANLDPLSRSAKIMRALNFNSCPGNNTKRKSVTKALNFDVPVTSPAAMQSPASNFSTSSPIDSIHLSISSTDSHSNSRDSIDENQNRTPSNPRKSAKKSLNYLTPKSDTSFKSPKINITPMLRSDLQEKINNIIEIGKTPNSRSTQKENSKIGCTPNVIINTSRNLYHDFEKEGNEDSSCPSTPKNVSKPIPESMSAIKKSHRKERLSKRFENHQTESNLLDDDCDMQLLEPDDILSTTPKLNQHSIHRVNSAKKLVIEENKDDDSDIEEDQFESLFNYADKENISKKSSKSPENKSKDISNLEKEDAISPSKKFKTPNGASDNAAEISYDFQIFTPIRKRKTQCTDIDNKSTEAVASTSNDSFATPVKGKAPQRKIIDNCDVTPENRSTNELIKTIEHSIKKSHKKEKIAVKQKALSRLNNSANVSLNDSTSCPIETLEPQPSTSHGISTAVIKSTEDEPIITPPSCLKVRTYLHHLHNSSIKKSHKKEREKRKMNIVIADKDKSHNLSLVLSSVSKLQKKELRGRIQDLDLSDDGSIFSEEDKTSFIEMQGAINTNMQKAFEDEAVDDDEADKNSVVEDLVVAEPCFDLN